MLDQLFEKYLPPHARDIVDSIGLADFQKLVWARGGTYVYVPHKIKPGCDLDLIVGYTSANKLTEKYAGLALEIPKCHSALLAIRNEEIKRRRAAGESERSVAIAVGLSGRHLRRINAGNTTDDDGQEDLFE